MHTGWQRMRACGLLLASALLASCSFSFTTAHITAFAIAKDKDAAQPASAFAPNDTVYAKVTVANVPSKVTLKWHLVAEKVTGFPEHAAQTDADVNFELAGDGTSTYTLRPPATGWPAGTYAVRVSMVDDSGTEKDQRSGTFSVGGTAQAPAATANDSAPAAANDAANATPAIAPKKRGISPLEGGKGAADFSEPEFSDRKHGDAADSFTPDTPKIFAHSEFSGVPNGATVTATWIAEKTRAAPPETKIVSTDVKIDANQDTVDFSITRPDKGWPKGSYRLDISVDGKVVTVGRFEIEK